jgi:poly(A) polymerase
MSFPDHLLPESLRWLHSESVRRIMDALRGGGGEARVVGGAVRDALLGRKVGDIDLAATLPPEKTSALLAEAGIKVAPTGIEHGTVTAVIDGKGYEITTLRRDVETDGRRAKVAFTDDWQSDAARRDFTINALYADAGGAIYDYFGGREDLARGHVRFIGDARSRIREDVLRILRFFRFYV